jgi:chromatin remodeling complex protein RSC6
MPTVKKVVKKSSKGTSQKSGSKKKVSKKSTTPAVSEPAAAPVEETVTETPVTETPVETPTAVEPVVEKASEPTLTESFDVLLTAFGEMTKSLRTLSQEFKKYHVAVNRRVSALERSARTKSSNSSANNALHTVDSQLATFLGVEDGAQMTPREVFSRFTAYFKEHNLHGTENKNHLSLDETLQGLFSPADGALVTVRNYRKYVTPHLTA